MLRRFFDRSFLARLPWPWAVLGASVLLAAILGGTLGYFMRFDLPDVRALEDYEPPLMTRVYAADGTLLDTFQEQRRIFIDSHEIPPVFRQALLASEDSDFYRHAGIDFRGIARAAWRDLRSLRLAQGASTLTQQLARNLFLTPQKTIRRKAEEALLAIEIERQYSKEEILGFYCNQIYMGHGRYGLEAAARFYFGVPARDLTLNQAVTLVGLIQRPEALSPFKHPERTLERRDYVLRRMVIEGTLTAERADRVRAEPIEVATAVDRGGLAPYFVEEIRRWLQARHGSSSLYTAGLEVRSSLDPRLQEIANRAVRAGLRELDRRQGWRGPRETLGAEVDLESWRSPDWDDGVEVGSVYDAVVLEAEPDAARVRVGEHVGIIGPGNWKWADDEQTGALLRARDVVRVRLLAAGADGAARMSLEQEPAVEAAVVVLDPSTGAIRALVGGYDFGRSEFNRAIQAKRQTGSAFKPFVYAAALAAGKTLADTLLDEPTVFMDPARPDPYQPENYTNKYYGTITLRKSMEKSANIATVKLLDMIGSRNVIETARRLGIKSHLRPYASLALGAFETTLLELTAAYGSFANEGVLVEPHLVEEVLDRDGRVIERVEPKIQDAVGPQVSYLMNRLLSGVITDGTGRSAASLNLPIAGKTGTTDDNTDAWFVGYGPGLAVGVWVGFDEPRSLGDKETGARAALPIWRAFMKDALRDTGSDPFSEPPGITRVSIDRRTGLRANPRAYCNPVVSEVFVTGTEPAAECTVYHHQRLRLPYPFQRYPLDEQGRLSVPADALDSLLELETNVRLVDSGRRLEVTLPNEIVSIGLRILLPDLPPLVPPAPIPPFDMTGWVGHDGRPAEVLWLGR